MDQAEAIQERLNALMKEVDLDEMEEVCDIIENMEDGAKFIPALIAVFEANPNFDEFGSPGAIVHTIEGFQRCAYEEHLLQSLRRKPTGHTIWMLNRIMNVEGNENWSQYLLTMAELATNEDLDDSVRERASSFLKHQIGKLL